MNALASQPVRIGVVIGSTRPGRFAEIPARWIAAHLDREPGVETRLLDLREFDLPHFDESMGPRMLGDQAFANEEVARWTREVEQFDGFIMVVPEYNHGYSSVLKNALDYVYSGWVRKPVAFVGYGSLGGARSVEQLRQVVIELQMAPVPTAVHLPAEPLRAHFMGGNPSDHLPESDDKAAAMIADLLWWTRALKVARESEVLTLAS